MCWNAPQRVIIPWMKTLANSLAQVELPDLRGRSLWVVSDYSFGNRASDFDVVALLVMDPEASGGWNDLRRAVRADLLRDERSMSWKKLNSDKCREAAFVPFLNAANHVCGLSIALAFHRSTAFQVPADGLHRLQACLKLSANWKRRSLRRCFESRIASP